MPPVGIVHALAAPVHMGNQAGAILNVGCIGCQRCDGRVSPIDADDGFFSHYRWQLRMFWCTLLWALIGWALVMTIIGAVVGVPILIALTLWLIYRIGRGWLRLRDRWPMYAA